MTIVTGKSLALLVKTYIWFARYPCVDCDDNEKVRFWSLVEEERVLHTFGDEQSYKNIFNDYYMYEVYYLFFRYV
jgi:hypothetical protein